MKGTSLVATLVIGPRWLVDGTAAVGDSDSVVLVDVPAGAATPGVFEGRPANTILVSFDFTADVAARAATVASAAHLAVTLPWRSLFFRMLPGQDLREFLPGDHAIPAFLVVSAGAREAHLYGRLRFSDTNALFVRLTDRPASVVPGEPPESWLREAVRLHAASELFLNNHQCYYFRMFPGEELEYKYTFVDGDIWNATVRLYNELRDGALPGYIVEYGDEFQTWDYLNYLYEVPEPPEEQGYISFIPLSTGGYTIKRKWFTEDTMRRGEKHLRESGKIEDFAAYISDRFGVTSVELPPFRRVRYDVNFESLTTGHVYGIFFDHSMVLDGPAALRQCELEYLRTRSVLPVNEADVLRELDEIAGWLEGFLTRNGIGSSRGVYSKLSFLKDVTGSARAAS